MGKRTPPVATPQPATSLTALDLLRNYMSDVRSRIANCSGTVNCVIESIEKYDDGPAGALILAVAELRRIEHDMDRALDGQEVSRG